MAKKEYPSRNNVIPIDLAGKIPPQAIDLEEAVLGALMLEKDSILMVIDILKPESFYKDVHQKIFKAILDLATRQEPIDLLTVTESLRRNSTLEDIGGPYYITQLTSKVASAAHIEFHARIIAQKHIQRELIRASSEIQNMAFDDSKDIDELLDFSESSIFKIAEGSIKKEIQPVNVLIKEAILQMQEAAKRDDNLSGIPSGFTKLDRLTSGWQRSDLIIIAGRPSMGKTAFVLSMARNMAAEHKCGVAIFSLEMSSLQLVNRLICAETELSSERIRNGRLENHEWEQLDRKIKTLVDAPIYIDDTPAISVYELRAKLRRLTSKSKIDIVIIDYLQLMTCNIDTRGSREQEVAHISRNLKVIAKELNVPILALSQLNRSVEVRSGTKRPQLSDLRESGAIEQDADIVAFIHRPEKYGFLEDEDGNSLRGVAEIIIAKHRNGALDDVRLRFRDEFAKFVDLEDIDPYIPEAVEAPKIFGSKMNQDYGKVSTTAPFEMGRNTGFDSEAPF